MFYKLKRKKPITGADNKGELFDIYVTKDEEVSEETFLELSNGTGDDPGYRENLT